MSVVLNPKSRTLGKDAFLFGKGDTVWETEKDYSRSNEDYLAHLHIAPKPEKESIGLTVKASEDLIFKLPIQFHELAKQIENSLDILNFEPDWDQEGGEIYSEETFKQAIEFTINYSIWIWNELQIVIEAPKIFPGPNGSIDLLWKNVDYDLLINIPSYPNKIATFYGDDKKETKVEGQFSIESYNQGVFLCLLNR